VKLHPNAKTTPYARQLLVDRVRRLGWSMQDAAQAAGISLRTAMPRSTVAAVLKRRGLERLSRLTPKPAVVRYERQHPGELLHLDTKKLGRFRRVGHRITGDRTQGSPYAGWEFMHVCIDDHSRLAYVERLSDERPETTTAFLRRAVRWFRHQGIRTERVMTDNGNGYVAHAFADVCRELGLRHLRTRPYTPRTNGKAERFIQTLLREWAYARPYRTSNQRTKRLAPWLRYYNHQRPHSALRGLPPQSRIRRPQ